MEILMENVSNRKGQDILICLVRKMLSADEKDRIAQTLLEGFAKYGCSMLVFVQSRETEDLVKNLAQICRERLNLSEDWLIRTSSEDLSKTILEFQHSVLYVVPDCETLPEVLDTSAKFLLVQGQEVDMQPWPDESSTGGSYGTIPVWTRHFNDESPETQKKMARIRTILMHRDLPGMPQDLLITGDTGTGKSYFAKNLPQILDPRYDDPSVEFVVREEKEKNDKPFVSGNCASLSPELSDALLFGAVKGAYTGCNEDKMGLIESAKDGILFLDEVGELPLQTQSKLLTALEERRFTRLGDTGAGHKIKNVKCCIVFGTNVDLEVAVQEYKSSKGMRGFREDLYFRINACHLRLPSFRERIGGGEKLTGRAFLENLIKKSCSQFDLCMTAGAEQVFKKFAMTYSWPGNYRSFRHIFQVLKVELLALNMGNVVSTHLMKSVVEETKMLERKTVRRSALHEKIREGRSLDQQMAIDRIFTVCPTASNCAAAGRAYYGEDEFDRTRNFSDTFKKLLGRLGLVFDKNAPEHLAPKSELELKTVHE